jgi:hypothetical protein
MPVTLWLKAKWSMRQPDCLNQQGEFPAVAQRALEPQLQGILSEGMPLRLLHTYKRISI